MSILIGADIVPSSSNDVAFSSGNMSSIIGEELTNELKQADYRIFNLECPLVDVASPIKKCGPALRACVSTAKGLKTMGVDLLTLANNHIMDQGMSGLESTFLTLRKEGISFVGAGHNANEASIPFLFEHKRKKIGVYACAEHEFSIAGMNKPGANPFDPLESFDHIHSLRKICDYIIVLYHGGKEHYRYPSPMLQRVCRKFVEKGSDLVICQHSHCIGCEEKYLNGTIVYGQGNFIFNSCNVNTAQTSLLVKIDDEMNVSYLPLEMYENGVRLANHEKSKQILSDFYERSLKIKDEDFLNDEYKKFAEKMIGRYLLTGRLFYKVLNRLSGNRFSKIFANIYSKQQLLALRNFIECEAHRELWINGIVGKTER